MKPNTGIALLSTTLAIVAGMFGAHASGLLGDSTADEVAHSAGFAVGHITMYTTDSETGAIKEYRQTDNLIVNNGENCAAKMLFRGGSATGSSVCTGANTEGFNFIAIGESSTAAADAQNALVDAADETGLATPIQGSIVWTNASGTGGAIAEITSVFTNSGASTETITESGLFNSTAANGMFARQTFTGIPVDVSDSLTVEWTITIGGGTVA